MPACTKSSRAGGFDPVQNIGQVNQIAGIFGKRRQSLIHAGMHKIQPGGRCGNRLFQPRPARAGKLAQINLVQEWIVRRRHRLKRLTCLREKMIRERLPAVGCRIGAENPRQPRQVHHMLIRFFQMPRQNRSWRYHRRLRICVRKHHKLANSIGLIQQTFSHPREQPLVTAAVVRAMPRHQSRRPQRIGRQFQCRQTAR